MKNRFLASFLMLFLTFSLAAGCAEQTATTTAGSAATTTAATTDSGPGTTEDFTGEFIVDASYVLEHHGDDNVILVDARGEETARKGTIKGAVSTNWQYLSNVENATQGDYEWGLILEPAPLAERLGGLGLDKDKQIILFAEGPNGWGEDARLLWTLRAAGYKDLKMVNGGLKALKEAGVPEAKEVTKLDPVAVEVGELDLSHVITTRELEETYDDHKILDVRAEAEYNGEVLYGEAKGGRLPGAVHVPFTDFFTEDETLKSNADLKAMFEGAGLTTSDSIVVYCTAGIRSAYAQLIMEMTGFTNSMNYDGSYYTWAATNEVEK